MEDTEKLDVRRASGPVVIEEPALARWLFASSGGAWIWLVARVWLGLEWLVSGWVKVFGGNVTWQVWRWPGGDYTLTGPGNIGWIRSGVVNGQHLQVGDAVAGFAKGALTTGTVGEHPQVAYSWYISFLEWIRDTGHPYLGPVVAIGELVIGIMLVLGLFTGIFAFLGAILNFSYVFAGTAGVNPAMIVVSILLVLAWRNAGWYGLDRFALRKLGTPWHRGELFHHGDDTPEGSTTVNQT